MLVDINNIYSLDGSVRKVMITQKKCSSLALDCLRVAKRTRVSSTVDTTDYGQLLRDQFFYICIRRANH